MVSHEEQINFFRLVSTQLQKDIECFAFGGNAMMFYGYKDESKDIDLLFPTHNDRDEFIRVLKVFGFEQHSPFKIYIPEKLKDKNKPLIFLRDDFRFDLFVEQIFQTLLSPGMKENNFAIHEFRGKSSLTMKIMKKEHILILKAVTERERDYDDIKLIIKSEKNLDWEHIIKEVVWQFKNGDGWVLLDMEKTMKKLRKEFFIPKKYLDQLYDASKKKSKK